MALGLDMPWIPPPSPVVLYVEWEGWGCLFIRCASFHLLAGLSSTGHLSFIAALAVADTAEPMVVTCVAFVLAVFLPLVLKRSVALPHGYFNCITTWYLPWSTPFKSLFEVAAPCLFSVLLFGGANIRRYIFAILHNAVKRVKLCDESLDSQRPALIARSHMLPCFIF